MNSNIKVKRIFEVNLVVFINIIINLNILGCGGCCRRKGFSQNASTHDRLIFKLPTTIQGEGINNLKRGTVEGNSSGEDNIEESYLGEENENKMLNEKVEDKFSNIYSGENRTKNKNIYIPSEENNFQENELRKESYNVNKFDKEKEEIKIDKKGEEKEDDNDNVEDQDLEFGMDKKDLLNMDNQGQKFFGPIKEVNEEEEQKEENNTDKEKNSNNDDKNEFQCVKTLEGHTDKVVSLIEIESGKLVSGSYDKTIRIWDINDKIGNEQVINENSKILCLLEFEKNKILSGIGDNSINLWDLENPSEKIFSFEGHTAWVNALVKCDSKCFASASNDKTIKIWDYFKRECVSTLTGHTDCILSLILLKNKKLCSGSADSTIRIWDLNNRNCILTLSEKIGGWVKCIMELDNSVLVTGWEKHNNIILWKNENNFKTLEGHTNQVRTFCQINKKYFASGSFDYTIKIWNIDSWECVQTLDEHKGCIICLISLKYQNQNDNENNQLIASCSNDKKIKIWKK